MAYFHVANFYDAPRRSARAGESADHGMVVKALDWGNGERKLMKVTASDGSYFSGGKFAVITKYTTEPNQVNSSTVPNRLGSRLNTISSGDHVVEVGHGAIMEFDATSLDASLAAASVDVGDECTVKDAKFCKKGTSGEHTGVVLATVHRIFGSRVVLELK